MLWRIVAVLAKPAIMMALLEVMSPIAESIGFHLNFLARMANAVSRATAMPYKEAEVVLLFLMASALLETGEFLWDLIVG